MESESAEAIKQISSLKCSQHAGEVLSLVCLDSDCEWKGLMCVECQYAKHQQHENKPLKYLLSQVLNPLNYSKNFLCLTAKIDNERQKIDQIVKKVPNSRQRTTINQTVEGFFYKLNQSIKKRLFGFEKVLIKKDLSVEDLNKELLKITQYAAESEEDKQLNNQEMYLKGLFDEITERRIEFEEGLKKKMDQVDILSIFTPPESGEKDPAFYFSETLKHSSITVTDKTKAQQVHNYSSNYILLEPMLEGKKKLTKKKTVKIHIDRLTSWICMGVAYKNIVSSAQYFFNTDEVGFGAFMVSNDGYTWHHSDESMLSYYCQWSYLQGETVILTIDPKTKKICFSKEGSSSPYEMSYDNIPGDQLYFCVTLNSHDESVSIVNN